MGMIDPTARIADGAILGADVVIGPYCVIGPNVVIGDGCRLGPHVHIDGHTTIGAGTRIQSFASLGTPPQSVKYRGGPTRLVVGEACDIREHVTMNTGTEDDGGLTSVGDRCMFMVGSHVGHDCKVGNNVIMANNVVLGGHVSVGDNVFFGGNAAVHQFIRIGEGAMIAGLSGISQDLIPFGYALGQIADLVGLNVVGLKRRGATRADMHRLRAFYRAAFFGAGTFRDRFEAAAETAGDDPNVAKIVAFIRAGGSRPLMKPAVRADRDEAAAEP